VFTGLVQDLGSVIEAAPRDGGVRLRIEAPCAGELAEGDSILVNGVCLTALAPSRREFAADLSAETLARSSLGALEPGASVNLELALRPADRLGGHIVQGHVDGVGTVAEVRDADLSRELRIDLPPELGRYVVEKGSIAVDGVSLTVSALDGDSFWVALIPETLERTNLTDATPGGRVNLEVDVIAKYVEKLVDRP
jgi:riboflavin synthase